ncbi:hypothetical protein KY342_05415 [Candidatus Woesearchaeota archaeon]|nr:hypothetical protein [Candidatus Woesearchaeota archaeon]
MKEYANKQVINILHSICPDSYFGLHDRFNQTLANLLVKDIRFKEDERIIQIREDIEEFKFAHECVLDLCRKLGILEEEYARFGYVDGTFNFQINLDGQVTEVRLRDTCSIQRAGELALEKKYDLLAICSYQYHKRNGIEKIVENSPNKDTPKCEACDFTLTLDRIAKYCRVVNEK